jgi:hypothetical protein
MFVGLVQDPRFGRGDDDGDPGRRRSWRFPRGLLIWAVVLVVMRELVTVADHEIGDFAGYIIVLVTLSVGVWRFDRWLSKLYWRGLRDYQS